jgi:Protein of unknown function (DUF3105)
MLPRAWPIALGFALATSGCGASSGGTAHPGGRADAAADATSRDSAAGPPDAGPSPDASDSSADSTSDAVTDSPDDRTASLDGAADLLDGAADSPDDAAFFDATPSPPMGPCGAVVQQRAIEGFAHVPVCSHVTYQSKPPSSGDHYPIWAAYRSYSSAIPEGFWVHDLEHGAVVFSYNCPSGCAADVAAAQSFLDGLPADPICDPDAGDPPVRMVMTPDPSLGVRFAASSWGWTLRANCFDPVAFGTFVQDHYGQGREFLCSQGEDLSLGVAPECGD